MSERLGTQPEAFLKISGKQPVKARIQLFARCRARSRCWRSRIPGRRRACGTRAIDKPRPGRVRRRAKAGRWTCAEPRSATATPVTHVEFVAAGAVIHTAPCDVAAPGAGGRATGPGRALSTAGSTRRWGASTCARVRAPPARRSSAGGARAPDRDDHGPAGAARDRRSSRACSRCSVTGPGRSGSTIFMQMLAGHPEILAWPPFEQEPRVVTYWIEVLRTLARPDSFMRQVAPRGTSTATGGWAGATRGRVRSAMPTSRAWLAGEAVEELAAFAQARIESLYGRLAARDGRATASPTSPRSCATTSCPTSRGSCIPQRARSCSCATRATCCARCSRPT